MTFAQALARIEELRSSTDPAARVQSFAEVERLLIRYADSIVQLAKVAEEMRAILHLIDDPRDYSHEAAAYDKLMKGEGNEG